MRPVYRLEPVIHEVFADKDLLDFGSPPRQEAFSPTAAASSSAPLNRLSQFVAGSRLSIGGARSQASAPAASPSQADEVSPERGSGSAHSGPIDVTCAAAFGSNVYAGSSDGQIAWYVLDPNTGTHSLKYRSHVTSNAPVVSISVMPKVGKIGILTGTGTFSFLSLPSLQPLVHPITPLKNVLLVALDNQDALWQPSDQPASGKVEAISLCIVKRHAVLLYRLSNRLSLSHDIPLPETPTHAVRSGDTLCIADSEKYSLIDLVDNHLLEILPISQAGESSSEPINANIAVVPGLEEFLFSSFTGASSLGVFVTKDGDPTRGTIDWTSHPQSLIIEGDNVIALLRDNTVVVHSIQQISTSEDSPRNDQFALVTINLLDPTSAPRPDDGSSFSTSSTTVSELLVTSDTSLQALVQESFVLQANKLLHEGDIEGCARLAEEERKRAKKGEIEIDKAVHTANLRFIWARLAHAYFADALFEEAGALFAKSKIDPRLFLRLFPDLCGSTIGMEEEIRIWKGLRDDVERAKTIEEAITTRLHRIYGDDIPEAEGGELKRQMMEIARSNLSDFLRKHRSGRKRADPSDKAVDTSLVKLLALRGDEDEVLNILKSPNSCEISDVEDYIDGSRNPELLLAVYRILGKKDKLLEVLKREAERRQDASFKRHAIQEVFDIVIASNDAAAIRENGLWLMKRNSRLGLEVFTSSQARSIVRFDDRQLVKDIQEIDSPAAFKYLENTVVAKRSADRALHNQLIDHLLSECEDFIKDEGVMFHFRELFDEYLSTRPHKPYCQYLAEMAQDSPPKETRLKTILFLQGSPHYDLNAAERRLEKMELLFYERAIVLGRLGQHERALELLAVKLRDSVSAETFCTQGGEVVPPKVAQAMTSKIKWLQPWAELGEPGRRRRGTIEGEARAKLIMALLKVYMDQGQSEARQTASLLNAQAFHLDDEKILEMLPNDWSLSVISDFAGRALKRQMHDRIGWQIVKAMSAGQNLQIAEEYSRTVGRLPPVIQTEASGGGASDKDGLESSSTVPAFSPPDEGSIPDREKQTFIERSSSSEKPSPDQDLVRFIIEKVEKTELNAKR